MRAFPLCIKISAKIQKAIFRNGLTHTSHQRAVIMQVMNTIQLVRQDLPALKKMTQIGSGIMAAGVAGAVLIQGPLIFPISTIFYNNSAL